MRTLSALASLVAMSATLLTGCSASGETSPSNGNDGSEVFSGTVSSLGASCEAFGSSATALLSTLQVPYRTLVWWETDSSSHECEAHATLTDEGTDPASSLVNSYGTVSLSVALLEDSVGADVSGYIAPTLPEKMDPIYDEMKQYEGTPEEERVVFPQQFPAAGWTYGLDSLTSAYPNRGEGEISLVLTTAQSVLECRYHAPTEAPLPYEDVVALCNEFRDLVYID